MAECCIIEWGKHADIYVITSADGEFLGFAPFSPGNKLVCN